MNSPSESKRLKVQVKQDHLSRISSGSVESAIAEMIWNALDADATRVDVDFLNNAFDTPDEIIISDNGVGLSHAEAEALFVALGGSWKAQKRKTANGRFLHGKDGEGRFKAFALGKVVSWTVTYRDGDMLKRFTIEGSSNSLDVIAISEEQTINEGSTGVSVRISSLSKMSPIYYDPHRALDRLTPIFALYLSNYPLVIVNVAGLRIDPSKAIKRRKQYNLMSVPDDGHRHSIVMDLIEWNEILSREILFCDENGFPLETYPKQVRGTGDFGYNAYLKSTFFAEQHDQNMLSVPDFNPTLSKVCDTAIKEIKKYFLDRMAENGRQQVEKWKAEKVYPYENEPETPVEKVERQVFDIVAINVNQNLPDFEESDRKTKAFQFRMLRQAIERSPEELQLIITEILNLPKQATEQLADLLQEVSLVGIIQVSKTVTDRLRFITGLEQILFNRDLKENLKERSQLHRILAQNPWVFGEAFSLSVDDQSLTEVLRRHLSKHEIDIVVDVPVKTIDHKRGIVDLMLSRSLPCNHSDELEHLVVELKAPKVRVGSDELVQIEKYAYSVASDERFRNLKARWHFWVISNELDSYAENRANQANREQGLIHQSPPPDDITIWCKTWSQIIRENKYRLQFIRERLNYTADREDALEYLRKTYAELTTLISCEEPEPAVQDSSGPCEEELTS